MYKENIEPGWDEDNFYTMYEEIVLGLDAKTYKTMNMRTLK